MMTFFLAILVCHFLLFMLTDDIQWLAHTSFCLFRYNKCIIVLHSRAVQLKKSLPEIIGDRLPIIITYRTSDNCRVTILFIDVYSRYQDSRTKGFDLTSILAQLDFNTTPKIIRKRGSKEGYLYFI